MSRPPEDHALADFAATSDPEAMARLFDLAAPKLLLLASHWTNNPAAAEDLVQVTFVQAVRDASSYDIERSAITWLAAILAHRALDQRRQDRRRRASSTALDSLPAADASPLGTAIDRELVERASTAIDELAPPYREVLTLRVVHGLEPTAIAHALGRPPATVRKQLERGREHLRGLLPVSLAAALTTILLPTRGLAAVRANVLGHVVHRAPWWSTTAAPLVMKKLGIGATIAIFTILSWLWLGNEGPPAPADRDATAPVDAPSPIAKDLANSPGPGPTRNPDRKPAKAQLTGDLIVTVLAAGQPTHGIGIELVPRDGRNEQLTQRLQTSDDRGRARFRELRPGRYRLRASEGVTQWVEVQAAQTNRATVSIATGQPWTGQVLDPTGAPVAGATVWRYPAAGRSGHGRGWPIATTTLGGTFEVRRVTDRGVVLTARHERWAESKVARAFPDRSEIQTQGHFVRLLLRPAPAALTLQILADRSPCKGALVEVRRPPADDLARHHARADDKGRCTLFGLAPGRATIVVRSHGFAPALHDLELPAGATNLTIDLTPTGQVRGLVLATDGTPLAGQLVRCQHRGTTATATTTDLGAFEFDDLPATEITLVAPGDELHAGRQHQVELTAKAAVDCVIRLALLPQLTGRVVDAARRPLAGFEVVAVRRDLGRNTRRPLEDVAGRWDYRSQRRTTTAIDGRFRVPVMPEVDYWLDIVEPGQWFVVDGRRFGTLRAPHHDLELELTDSDLATAHLTGRVLDSAGHAVAGAHLQLGDGTRLGTVGRNTPGDPITDARGRFRIGPVPARTYELTILPAGHVLPDTRVPALQLQPSTTLTLGDVVLDVPASVNVRALYDDDSSPAKFSAEIRQAGRPATFANAGPDGVAHCALLPGNYTITLFGDALPQRRRQIVLTAGMHERLEVRVPRAIRFALALKPPPNEERGLVEIRGPGGELDFAAATTAEDPYDHRVAPALVPGVQHATIQCDDREYTATFLVTESQPPAPGGRPAAFTLTWQRSN